MTRVKWDISNSSSSVVDDRDVVLTYIVIIGASMDIDDSLSLQTTYNRLFIDDATLVDKDRFEGNLNNLDSNTFNIGFQYKLK